MPGTLRNCRWSVRLQGQVRRGTSGGEAEEVHRVLQGGGTGAQAQVPRSLPGASAGLGEPG